jgi:prepilin-type N-terminal cleavage/methylation domain-containing protein
MIKKGYKLGFTLIELLVVIAIIGVLASIVLASLNSAREKSRDARRITDIKQIQLALELYFDGDGAGQYPLAEARSTANCNPGTSELGLEVLTAGNYIPQVPVDPNLANPNDCYAYASVTGTRTDYHLAATLEDSGHSALSGDKDCTSAAAGCGAAAYTAGFAGADDGSSCHNTATADDNGCYDVVP